MGLEWVHDEKTRGVPTDGKLLQVMVVLGLEADITRLAADDVFGRKLEDSRLTEFRQRAPRQNSGKEK